MNDKMDFMDNKIYMNIINQNVGYIKSIMLKNKLNKVYDILVILGSGLGEIADSVKKDFEIKYNDMPYMPSSKVASHKSKFVFGQLMGRNVVVMVGRIHYYEGYSMKEVTLPVRIMSKLGVSSMIVTNASGAINKKYKLASIVSITDHINYSSLNPLRGDNLEEFGERFPDMSNIYEKKISDKIIKVAKVKGLDINEGVYLYTTGPSYETKSEIKMFKKMGADIVAMSTVPEVIVAKHCKMKVIGFSSVTNICDSDIAPNHDEVLSIGNISSKNMLEVIKLAMVYM